MIGRSVGRLVGWLVFGWFGWLVGSVAGWLVGLLVVGLILWLIGWARALPPPRGAGWGRALKALIRFPARLAPSRASRAMISLAAKEPEAGAERWPREVAVLSL